MVKIVVQKTINFPNISFHLLIGLETTTSSLPSSIGSRNIWVATTAQITDKIKTLNI
jgi:hypothetical protein